MFDRFARISFGFIDSSCPCACTRVAEDVLAGKCYETFFLAQNNF